MGGKDGCVYEVAYQVSYQVTQDSISLVPSDFY